MPATVPGLKPHTDRYQKTLLPVAGKPTLDFIVEPLFDAGIFDITFIVGHFKEQVIEYIKKYNGNFSLLNKKKDWVWSCDFNRLS